MTPENIIFILLETRKPSLRKGKSCMYKKKSRADQRQVISYCWWWLPYILAYKSLSLI